MARGAATEKALGGLHNAVAKVYIKVLQRYEARLDALDAIDPNEIEDEVLRELMEDGAMPNPAMMSAITKFLKDNDIGLDDERVAELSDTERRLEERRLKRTNLTVLTNLPLTGNG